MAYERSDKLICVDIDPNAWMQGAIDITGADKVGDENTYVVTVDTNVWMHWVYEYGWSTLKLLRSGTVIQTILNNGLIHPENESGYPEIESYAIRSGWASGGVFSYEIPKTYSEQTITFGLQFTNGACSPSSATVSKQITIPKKKSGMHVNVGGTWKEGRVFVKVDGAWKEGQVFTKVNGTWKEGV